jgi:hypothetical protein
LQVIYSTPSLPNPLPLLLPLSERARSRETRSSAGKLGSARTLYKENSGRGGIEYLRIWKIQSCSYIYIYIYI